MTQGIWKFLKALEEEKVGWTFDGPAIRCKIKGYTFCPATLVRGVDLTIKELHQIYNAADKKGSYDKKLREKLLEICKLEKRNVLIK